MKLNQLAIVSTHMKEADFWIVRRGSIDAVGNVTVVYNPEHYGVKVLRTDLLVPEYLFYLLDHLHNKGYYRPLATGTTELVNIRLSDVVNLNFTFK